MIVPSSRLLYWVALVVLPFSILGALEPSAAFISLGIIGALIVVVLLDAIGARGRIKGFRVQLPEVVRLSKNREAKIELRVLNQSRRERTLRFALAFPREIHAKTDEMTVSLPRETEWSRFSLECLPKKRGNYPIQTAYLEISSPLGFWGMRRSEPIKSEIRVYPNLMTERKNLAALFLNRGNTGLHAQRQVGKGRDFEKLREYIPGDGFDEIHWKATAKRGHPITKIFQIEKTQEVYVIVDYSRLTARIQPSTLPTASATTATRQLSAQKLVPDETTVLERFVTAALVLGLAAEQQGDLFGLLTFADKVGTFVRARNGQAHYSACRDALYTLQPQSVTPDFDELATFIRLRLRRRALLVFLTALDDPLLSASFVRNMDLICRQHLILVNMLQPKGVSPLFSRPDVASYDDLFQHLGGHLLWHNLRELEKVLQRRGVRFSLLENERMSAQLVSQYLGVKQRQLL